MSTKTGMNAATVRSYSGTLQGKLDLIDHAQGQLLKATLISQNPIDFLLSPGSLVLAPGSIAELATASAELILAKGSARELVTKLLAEAAAQEWASEGEDASYASGVAWKTPDTKTMPELNPWDFLGAPVLLFKSVADDVITVEGYAEDVLRWGQKHGPEFLKKAADWWDEVPPWAKKLKRFSKLIPYAGAALSLADFGVAVSKGDVWGMVRNGVSAGLDAASIIADATVVGAPVGGILAAAGVVWDLGWDEAEGIYKTGKTVIENPQKVLDYYDEYPWMMAVNGLVPVTLAYWGPGVDD